MSDPGPTLAAAESLLSTLGEADRELRRAGTTIPPKAVISTVSQAFWSFVATADRYDRDVRDEGASTEALAADIRARFSPWLDRSAMFNRSLHKPHGYAGDYRLIEKMYDLETGWSPDPTAPAMVNCIDSVFNEIHTLRSVWERRHWYTGLLRREYDTRGRLSLLDVACGGARYVFDFLESIDPAADVELTLLDQDPAAIEYCRARISEQYRDRVHLINVPIKRVGEALSRCYDVIVSAGLFDYLPDAVAAGLLQLMRDRADVVAITNFHPDNPSRIVKDWLVDWRLIYRTESEVASLFGKGAQVALHRDSEKALVLAEVASQ